MRVFVPKKVWIDKCLGNLADGKWRLMIETDKGEVYALLQEGLDRDGNHVTKDIIMATYMQWREQ